MNARVVTFLRALVFIVAVAATWAVLATAIYVQAAAP